MSVQETLNQRQTTHGDFADHAQSSDGLLNVMMEGQNWDTLLPEHREALRMIGHKIARILSGNPNFEDHWHDIAGYASLGERACSRRL